MALKFLILSFVVALLFSAVPAYAQACTQETPLLSITPQSVTGFSGGTFIFDISLTNRDSMGCTARTFNLSASVSGMNFFLRPTSVAVAPQDTVRATLDVNIPSNTTPSIVSVAVHASNSSGIVRTAVAQITVLEESNVCGLSVDKLDTLEEGTNNLRADFLESDKAHVRTEISLSGGRSSSSNQVIVNLLVNGRVYDSKSIFLLKNSFQEFNFDNLIDTTIAGGTSASIRVEASTACDPDGADRSKVIRFTKPTESCEFSTFASTPTSSSGGITTSVLLKNRGTVNNVIHYDAFMCGSDGNNCREISCGSQNNININAGNFTSFLCSATASPGIYHIKLETVACGKLITTISDTFTITASQTDSTAAPGVCTEKFLTASKCSGSIRQTAFQRSDCSVEYSDSEYCPFGCSEGICNAAPQSTPTFGKPEVLAKREYEVSSCGTTSDLSFDLKNSGDADTFEISVTGEAAQWVSVDRSVQLKKGEAVEIPAKIIVPCDAEEGVYDLKLSAKSTSTQTVASSSLLYMKTAPSTSAGDGMIAAMIGISFALLIGLVYLGYRHFAR